MRGATRPSSEVRLLSNVPGRQRWYVPCIQNKPRVAAAVEMMLRREARLLCARVNVVTGRILIQSDAWQSIEIELLIRKALARGPVSDASYKELHRKADAKIGSLVRKLAVGAFKLSLALFSRLVWGTTSAGPLGGLIQL